MLEVIDIKLYFRRQEKRNWLPGAERGARWLEWSMAQRGSQLPLLEGQSSASVLFCYTSPQGHSETVAKSLRFHLPLSLTELNKAKLYWGLHSRKQGTSEAVGKKKTWKITQFLKSKGFRQLQLMSATQTPLEKQAQVLTSNASPTDS